MLIILHHSYFRKLCADVQPLIHKITDGECRLVQHRTYCVVLFVGEFGRFIRRILSANGESHLLNLLIQPYCQR